jgi:hypothetical protein
VAQFLSFLLNFSVIPPNKCIVPLNVLYFSPSLSSFQGNKYMTINKPSLNLDLLLRQRVSVNSLPRGVI